MHPAAAAQAAIFSLFGRGAAARQRPQMMDEDDGEESEGDADDTFAHEDPRRVTLDPDRNEVTLSDEEAAGMMEGCSSRYGCVDHLNCVPNFVCIYIY